jgi:hypothetical protein
MPTAELIARLTLRTASLEQAMASLQERYTKLEYRLTTMERMASMDAREVHEAIVAAEHGSAQPHQDDPR